MVNKLSHTLARISDLGSTTTMPVPVLPFIISCFLHLFRGREDLDGVGSDIMAGEASLYRLRFRGPGGDIGGGERAALD